MLTAFHSKNGYTDGLRYYVLRKLLLCFDITSAVYGIVLEHYMSSRQTFIS